MRRILRLLAVAATLAFPLASPLAAQEPPSPSDRPLPPVVEGDDGQAPNGDVEFQVMPGADDACSPCFYPVYDCGCRLQPLDCWCNCETAGCVTDQWCEHPCFRPLGTQHLGDEPGQWMCNDDYCDVFGTRVTTNHSALRMGYWGVSSQGSPVKTGEYQSLRSSPFFELDTLQSSGVRTLDMILNGVDNEGNNAFARYYSPGLTANVRYQRFFRQLDHDPLYGFNLDTGVPTAADNVVTRDLNAGDDYAIRVQQLDARFQGQLTQNIKWKLNLWGMRKFGERQVNSIGHCFDLDPAAGSQNNKCHLQSQRQGIDWLTMQIEPGIEAKYEYVSIEYQRTMRSFGQNDELATRQYSRFNYSPASGVWGPPYAYAYVPENFTQIDRLKVGLDLNESNKVYTYAYYGDTRNQFRDTHRQFSGVDVRLINTSVEGATITAYGTFDEQNNDIPPQSLTTTPWAIPGVEPASLEHPVDYLQYRFGVRTNWKPNYTPFTSDPNADLWSRTIIVSGYEYGMLERNFANWSSQRLGNFVQPDTKGHRIELGPQTQLSETVNTYIRYKGWFNEDPLIGVRESTGRFNTNLPEQEHRVEVGGTWNPSEDLIATVQVSFVNRWNNSLYTSAVPPVPIHFNENNYPITATLFYAPTEKLALNTGYAYFSNWIEQDIAIGFRTTTLETMRFNYLGESHVFSLGANYALTETVKLVGGYEWTHGTNGFANPTSTTGANWSLGPGLASYSDVNAEIQRFTAGIDWEPYRRTNLYARYNYFDYNDLSENLTSGSVHMLLTGVTFVR
ncbi:MAG: hypothetical protein U0935_08575 [Pirellulales bacterium]